MVAISSPQIAWHYIRKSSDILFSSGFSFSLYSGEEVLFHTHYSNSEPNYDQNFFFFLSPQ